ncbi:MAG: phosphatase PAP2 family protein [Anaerolineae bacterium]|nr:MAG: phosphatase PAP2 family protein [Anaerolineae bacterium]
MVDWFIDTCRQSEHDVYYAIIEKSVMETAFPESKRSYVPFREGRYCGGDLFMVRLMAANQNEALVRAAMDRRKSAFRQAQLLGFGTLLKFVFHRLTIPDAEKVASRVFGARPCCHLAVRDDWYGRRQAVPIRPGQTDHGTEGDGTTGVNEQPGATGTTRTVRQALGDIDRRLSARMARRTVRRHLSPGLVRRPPGDGYLWVVVAALALWLGDAAQQRGTWGWIISMAIAAAITTSTKFVLQRRRPHTQGGFYSVKYDQHSFPSGHATRMGTIAVWGLLLLPGWGWLLVVLAVWTSWSRVALRVHFLADVVSGLLVGCLVSLVVWRVMA